MKKIIACLLVVLALTCLLCACGDKDDKDDNKTNHTTQPIGNTEDNPEQTKIYYKTDAAGSTITTVIVLPGEGETFPIKTIAPTEESAAPTTSPTFTFEDDTPFNDATLAW